MEQAETPLPEPPSRPVSGQELVKFGAVHLLFLAMCFAIGETVFVVFGHSSIHEIGPGQEFPTLDAAELALAVEIGRGWMAVGVFSAVMTLAVWLWNRSFRWFWIPLAFVPYIGPVFFAAPATWAIANQHPSREAEQHTT
jgi:hypothetical protein